MKRFLAIGLVLVLAGSVYAGINDRFSDINLTDDEKVEIPEISAPSGNPATNKGWLYVKDNSGTSDIYFEDDGGTVTELTASASGVSNLDEAYDGGGSGAGRTITVDQGAVLLNMSHATNNGLELTKTAGAGHAVQITNSGTGNDVRGTSGTWYVDKTGAGTFSTITPVILDGDITIDGNAADIFFDTSADTLRFNDSAILGFGTGTDISLAYDGSNNDLDITGSGLEIAIGADDEGIDIYWHTETASDNLFFDETNSELLFTDVDIQLDDDADLIIGTGNDWVVDSDTAKTLDFIPATTDETSIVNIGSNTAGADLKLFPAATGDYLLFDASANEMLSVDVDIQLDDDANLVLGTDDDWVAESDTAKTLEFIPATTDETSTINVGADTAGADLKLFGATTSEYWLFDASADSVLPVLGNYLYTATDAEADQFKVDATGTVAGNAINLETTDGGVLVNADGAANGDIELNSADDMTFTSAGDLTLAVTGTVSAGGSAVTNVLNDAEVVTAANVITATECGKTFYLNSATEFQSTLPALSGVSAGCEMTFIVSGAASGANYTIITGNSLENQVYGLISVDSTHVACADEDTITLVDGNAKGDWVKVKSDGTSWYITGETLTAAKLTCTQAD